MFLNEEVIRTVAPRIVSENRGQEVSAMLRPAQWSPSFLLQEARSTPSESKLDWGGSFFDDARTFVELLSLSHAAPIVTLMEITYCVHRTANLLLGLPHYHDNTNYKA